MFIAQAYLLVPDSDGRVMSILPGDVIHNFASWPELARRAHLNQNLVCEQADDELMAIEKRLYGGRSADCRPFEPLEPAADEVDRKPIIDVADAADLTEPRCELCDRVFKDGNGLKIHQSRVHKSVARQED